MHDPHHMDEGLQQAIAKMCADSGTIHIKDSDELILHLVASHNIPASLISAIREVPWGRGMAGVAAQKGEPVDYCNIQSSTSPEIHPGARATGTQGAIVVPMMQGNDVVGTLGVGCNTERSFTASEIRWLMDFARRLVSDSGDHRMAA